MLLKQFFFFSKSSYEKRLISVFAVSCRIVLKNLFFSSPLPLQLNSCFIFYRNMECFRFRSGEKKVGPKSSRSFSSLSYPTESTDQDMRRSGSELSSRNASDMSAESFRRNSLPSLSERPNTLKAFTFSELKIATKNFSPSLLVGEGGFGCVYRGIIKDPMDAHNKVEVAVKQLNRKGFQVTCFHFVLL